MNSISNKTRKHHGMYGTPEYISWCKMIQRCCNPKCDKFKYYGGRGITICTGWRNSFVSFYSDMGKCPEGYTLDRKDFNGNYEPSNCRWASKVTQSRNRGLSHNNTSGVSGVHYVDRFNKWMARINVDDKRISLGYFKLKEDAIGARKEAEKKYWGQG